MYEYVRMCARMRICKCSMCIPVCVCTCPFVHVQFLLENVDPSSDVGSLLSAL